MTKLPDLIRRGQALAPDMLCGWTPCQAFSLAWLKDGLENDRGKLTLTFIEIADAIDETRKSQGKGRAVVFWENVEWVLTNKTNPFWNFLAGLAWFEDEIKVRKWTKSGYVEGPKRNVAWRVLDAKHFGLPQQRKRLYVLAWDKDFRPDLVLFEELTRINVSIKSPRNDGAEVFWKNGVKFETFRWYTDCLYSAYGTKWNGNAAAYNGSLFIAQDDRVRRFTPLECERLMWFPDNYTEVNWHTDTTRYQAVWNSWAVPVIRFIWKRLSKIYKKSFSHDWDYWSASDPIRLFDKFAILVCGKKVNTSDTPNSPLYWKISDIVQHDDVSEKFYLSKKGWQWILRRKFERNMNMNPRLELLLSKNEEPSRRKTGRLPPENMNAFALAA